MPSSVISLHGTSRSGHTHRAALFLTLLDLPYTLVEAPAEVRATPAFRQLNPLGQIPVLVDGEQVICDSHAILVYLAKRYAPGTAWLPEDPVGAAQVQRWLAIAAGELRFGPATARLITLFKRPGDLARAQAMAGELLGFLEAHLGGRAFLAAAEPTIADLALYAYVARAPEGGVSLEPFPTVRAWLARLEALPRFLPMPRS